jgi:hypothetical protein
MTAAHLARLMQRLHTAIRRDHDRSAPFELSTL